MSTVATELPDIVLKTVFPGEGRVYRFRFRKVIDGRPTGLAPDLSNTDELTFTVRESAAASINLIQKVLNSGVTVESALAGWALVTLLPADTKNLEPGTRPRFDLVFTPTGGTRRVVARGVMPIGDGVADPAT